MVKYNHGSGGVANKVIIVLVGLDNPETPPTISSDIHQLVEDRINRSFGLELGTLDVFLTTSVPSDRQKDILGEQTLTVHQYDIQTPWEEVDSEKIKNIEFEVKQQLSELNMNITGTESIVIMNRRIG